MVVDLDNTHGLYHAIPYHIIPNTIQFKIAITESILELRAPYLSYFLEPQAADNLNNDGNVRNGGKVCKFNFHLMCK